MKYAANCSTVHAEVDGTKWEEVREPKDKHKGVESTILYVSFTLQKCTIDLPNARVKMPYLHWGYLRDLPPPTESQPKGQAHPRRTLDQADNPYLSADDLNQRIMIK